MTAVGVLVGRGFERVGKEGAREFEGVREREGGQRGKGERKKREKE